VKNSVVLDSSATVKMQDEQGYAKEWTMDMLRRQDKQRAKRRGVVTLRHEEVGLIQIQEDEYYDRQSEDTRRWDDPTSTIAFQPMART
jgi:hypothetical protein